MPNDVSEISNVPLGHIFADSSFNSRGFIAPIDVVELAKEIEKNGLQQAISLKPLENGDSKNPEHKYKVIAGHRRFKAFEVLKRETIPAAINRNISETDALILNLTENLHRKDLNILQEARALERLKMTGFSYNEVAVIINKSNTWVRIRFQLLELPDAIKEAAAAGYFNQTQIKELHQLGDYKKQIEAAKKIKEA